jgi:anaerobic ribonucleoside-triphosphate reductase activating protein
MKIAYIDYSIGTTSLDIYVSGCNPPHCPGCYNSELFDFDNGAQYNYDTDGYILDYCNMFDNLIDKILIMGGEPLHQNQDDMMNLLYACRKTGKKVWLFTRHNLEDVPEIYLKYLDFVKTGMYNEKLLGEVEYYGIKLATTNQKVIKIE